MAPLSELFRLGREATKADPDELARLRRRVSASVRGDRDAVALLRTVDPADPALVARLRDRLLVPRHRRGRGPVLLAVAAAVALAVAAWRPSPAPVDDTLALELDAEAPRTLEATEEVELRFAGHGRARGSRKAPRIAWQRGRIELEVEHGRGIDLVVDTPEAEVAVVGTVFDVDRDALGTAVHVTRGEVAVRCRDGATHALHTGDATVCLPVDAPGLLGRARTLLARGGDLDAVLGALDAALAAAPGDLVRGELLATRTRALLDAGRTDDALETARRYLAEGHAPRREELRALVDAYRPPQPEVSP